MRRLFGTFGVLGFAVILGSPAFTQIAPDGAAGSLSRGATGDKVTQPLHPASRHSSRPSAKEEAETSAKIHIRLRDYARAPKKTLARAIGQTTEIFQGAGVEIEWILCKLSAEGLPDDRQCKERLGPSTLLLRILPRSMAEKRSPRYEEFGYAVPLGKGEFGSLASVLFHRVDELAAWQGEKVSRRIILGHLMAHEIGHLLLGPKSHSATGIMRASWHPKDLQRAAQGGLLFTRRQGQQMRANALDRIRAEGSRGDL